MGCGVRQSQSCSMMLCRAEVCVSGQGASLARTWIGDGAVPGSCFLGLQGARGGGFCSGSPEPRFFTPVKFQALMDCSQDYLFFSLHGSEGLGTLIKDVVLFKLEVSSNFAGQVRFFPDKTEKKKKKAAKKMGSDRNKDNWRRRESPIHSPLLQDGSARGGCWRWAGGRLQRGAGSSTERGCRGLLAAPATQGRKHLGGRKGLLP